jgi:hypothetical protein
MAQDKAVAVATNGAKEPTVTDSKIRVDVSGWRMRETREWDRVALSGSVGEINKIMSTVVKEWEWDELDPWRETSYDELTPSQWKAVVLEVGKAVKELFR